jgi:hypothetical protein
MKQWLRRRGLGRHAKKLGLDFNCADQESPSWQERAVIAVDLLRDSLAAEETAAPTLTIADFGAGNERLRAVLAAELGHQHTYFPYDLQPQKQTTMPMNFAEEFPARRFDAIFCLGLVEYLPDLPDFFRRLAQACDSAVVSYALADGAEKLSSQERRERGWMTDYTRREVEELLQAEGFAIRAYSATNRDRTGVWHAQVAETTLAR